jgi:hypothetical protein
MWGTYIQEHDLEKKAKIQIISNMLALNPLPFKVPSL